MLISSRSSKTLTTPVDFEGVLHFFVPFSLNIYQTSVRIIAIHEAAKTSLVSFWRRHNLYWNINGFQVWLVPGRPFCPSDSNINTIPGLAFDSNLHYSGSLGTSSDAAKSPHFVHEITQRWTAEAPVVSLFEGTYPLYLGSPGPRWDGTICRP